MLVRILNTSSVIAVTSALVSKGGVSYFPPKFANFFVPVITFPPLSSVQIIIIPACCLLCVL